MKKILTIVAAGIIATGAAFAQSPGKPAPKANPKPAAKPNTKAAPAANKPKPALVNGASIAFEKMEHDFGTLTMGPQAAVSFKFSNNGTEAVVLTDVHASCGCTTPEWPREPIAPGQNSEIKAIYNTAGRPGYFEKTIFVTYNGKTVELKIKGTVQNNGSDTPNTNGQLR
ncbi:MAG: hypothetical protein RLZZ370_430 [Bacteroidota bacterium]|jgi:hypothetical protein